MTAILFIVLALAILIRVPLAFALGFSCLFVMLLMGNIPIQIMPQRIFAGIDSFSLLAIPFFLLAGNLMTASGITDRVLRFANAVVGRLPGGLAMSNIVANIFFGGISGSAVADTAAIGSVLIPAMVREGYGKAFTVAVNASASVVAPIIPPSIVFIVFGVLTGESIVRLFLAGAVPGVAYGLMMMVIAYVISKKRNYPRYPAAGLREIWQAFKDSFFALFMPIFILGGIISGAFTVTECSAMAVVYALIVGLFVYKGLTFKDLIPIIKATCHTAAIIMLIVGMAKFFSWVLVNNRVPQTVASLIMETTRNPIMLLLLINVVLLIVGCFMEANAALVMLVPVLLPIAQAAGVSPIHFGVIACVNLCLGLVTPPVGLTLNLSCEMGGCKLEEGAREALPFLIVGILFLLVLTYVPAVSMTLPSLVMR
jgi:C4-dicarboxylate transporter DctM subunit